jgi:hypothetical protein
MCRQRNDEHHAKGWRSAGTEKGFCARIFTRGRPRPGRRFGFWFDNSGISLSPLTIIKADANDVYFDASTEDRVVEKHITGKVDGVTGTVYADDFIIFLNGDMQHRYWDLDCKPTHSLFLASPNSGLLNER